MTVRRFLLRCVCRAASALAALAVLAGCAKHEERAASKTTAEQSPTKHQHKAPHDGTPVVLGNEAYHLELVREPTEGKLTAYVLDGEMENFIRVKTPSFDVVATVGGAKRPLTFKAVPNTATGETIGDTAQFEAQAEWLKTVAGFDALLTALEIRGSRFENVAFNFPKGNDKE